MKKETAGPGPSTDIKHYIMKLHALREQQEERLKHDVREVLYEFTPSVMIKNTLKDLKGDPDFRQDAIKQGVSIGTNFLLDAIIFRNGFGLKSMLLSQGLKKAASYFMNRKRSGKAETVEN